MKLKTMTWSMAAALAVVLMACGGSASQGGSPPALGSARVHVALTGTHSVDVDHVDLRVVGAAFDETVAAQRSGDEFQGELTKLPAGDYTLEANAYDAQVPPMLMYHTLAAVPFAVHPGEETTIPVLLQEVAPPPFLNGAPFISAFQASSDVIAPPAPGLRLAAQFLDADAAAGGPGDTLGWAWSADCGSFAPVETGGDDATGTTTDSPKTITVAWTGQCTGAVTITLRVTDDDGQAAALSQTFQMSPGYGQAFVHTAFNDWPVIGSMLIDNSQIVPGASYAVTVAAADADGDALAYKWGTTCPNATIVAGADGEASFTAGDAASVCYIMVRVSEAAGLPDHPGFVEGQLQVMIDAVDPEFGPAITFAYMTPKYVANGVQSVLFEAYAFDPDGDALTWSWTLDAGTSDETLTSLEGSAIMTVGACADAPKVVATVTDGIYSNSVKFYPSCPSTP